MNHDQLVRRAAMLSVILLSLFVQQVSTPDVGRAHRSTQGKRPFRMLVLGDSVLWGQGLATEHKFSYQVREWICQQRNNGICQNKEDVQIHVEAHSGAFIAQPEAKAEREKEERFTRILSPVIYQGEVNHPYPSVWGQVDLARRHYIRGSIPLTEVDLILVNGGINDMGSTKILLPFVGGNLAGFAERYCQDAMKLLLDKLVSTFPNARIVVPGYFPLVSTSTPEKVLLETIGYLLQGKKENANSQGAIEEASTNSANQVAGIDKPSGVLKSLAERSQQWTVASNAAFAAVVKNFNSTNSGLLVPGDTGQAAPPEASLRVLFVAVPFSDENAYAANRTFLWKLVPKPPNLVLECADKDRLKKLMVNDELQKERPCMCDQAEKGNEVSCVRAAAFHPNREGADQYSKSIIKELEKIWQFTGWASGN